MMDFLGFSFVFAISLVGVLITMIIWIWGLIDCLKSDKEPMDKILWTLVILVLNFIGSIIYFLAKDSVKVSAKKSRLTKSPDRIFAGVCGGIAEYFKVDPTIIRLIWVLLTIFSFGTGILLYVIAAIIIPEKDGRKNSKALLFVIGILLIILFAFIALIVVSYSGYEKGASVSRHVTVIDPAKRAENIAIDHIRSHPNFESGYNLMCYSVAEVDDCSEFHDPYGIRISGCYLVRCKYDIHDTSEGYTVETLVYLDKIRSMTFDQIPQPIRQLKDNNSICIDMCGDGKCQEMVCMGEGCPCAETQESCPMDCAKS